MAYKECEVSGCGKRVQQSRYAESHVAYHARGGTVRGSRNERRSKAAEAPRIAVVREAVIMASQRKGFFRSILSAFSR